MLKYTGNLKIQTPHRRAYEREVDRLIAAYARVAGNAGADYKYRAELKAIKMADYDWTAWFRSAIGGKRPYGAIPASDYADWARSQDRKQALRLKKRDAQSALNYQKAFEKVVHHVNNGSGGCMNESNHGSCFMCWRERKVGR